MELVYEPVPEDTELNGVKASDNLPMVKALETIGESLDGESVDIDIPGVENVLNAEEKARFDKLPVKERLLVTLSALGFGDALGDASGALSDEGRALADDISARMESMPEAEKQALLAVIAAEFPKQQITVDGKTFEAFSIDVVIDRDGQKTYERYTFYNDGAQWILYGIEVGEYREVEA